MYTTYFFIIPKYKAFTLQYIISYLEVGRLLHSITIISIPGTWFCLIQMQKFWLLELYPPAYLYLYLSVLLGSVMILAELDAWSRYQNYKMVRDYLYKFGFRTRIVSPMKHSKCQREAAYMAARNLGYGKVILNYFRTYGYMWYHLLPDFIRDQPEYILTHHFWLSTFFAKTYHCRYYPEV